MASFAGRRRIGRFVAIGCLGLMAAVAACSSDDSAPGPQPSGVVAGEYKGEFSGPKETGVIDVTLSGGSLKANALRLLDTQDEATVVGTLTLGGGVTVQLTGSFDPDTGAFTLTGGGYSFTGSATSGGIAGSYTGPNGPGSFTLVAAGSGAQVILRLLQGQDQGIWNLVIGPTSAAGSVASTSGTYASPMQCTVSGTSLSCTASGNLTATGTVNGTAASGTWTDGTHSGTWAGDGATCPVPHVVDAGADATSLDASASDTGTGANDASTEDVATPVDSSTPDGNVAQDAGPNDSGGADTSAPQEDAASPTDASSPEDASAPGDADLGPVVVTSRNTLGGLVTQTWAVWQDGSGAWTTLTPTSTGVYELTPTSATYGVALMCASANNQTSEGVVFYRTGATRQIATTAAANACAPVTPPATPYTFGGTMTNLPANASWQRNGSINGFGDGQLQFTGTSTASYIIYNFGANVPYDIALAVASDSDQSILKMLFVRGQTFSANVTRDVDWNAEGFVPGASYTAAISNATSNTTMTVGYTMSGGGMIAMSSPGALQGSTFSESYAAVTSGAVTGDGYLIDAVDSDFTNKLTTEVKRTASSAGDVTTTLPATFAISLGVNMTSAYLRPTYAMQSQYGGTQSYAFSWHYGPAKGVAHDFVMDVDPAWLPPTAPYSVTFPDFSATSGWVDAWAPTTGDAGPGSVSLSAKASLTTAVSGGQETRTSRKDGTVP